MREASDYEVALSSAREDRALVELAGGTDGRSVGAVPRESPLVMSECVVYARGAYTDERNDPLWPR